MLIELLGKCGETVVPGAFLGGGLHIGLQYFKVGDFFVAMEVRYAYNMRTRVPSLQRNKRLKASKPPRLGAFFMPTKRLMLLVYPNYEKM